MSGNKLIGQAESAFVETAGLLRTYISPPVNPTGCPNKLFVPSITFIPLIWVITGCDRI
jgi:hypothetical protein